MNDPIVTFLAYVGLFSIAGSVVMFAIAIRLYLLRKGQNDGMDED